MANVTERDRPDACVQCRRVPAIFWSEQTRNDGNPTIAWPGFAFVLCQSGRCEGNAHPKKILKKRRSCLPSMANKGRCARSAARGSLGRCVPEDACTHELRAARTPAYPGQRGGLGTRNGAHNRQTASRGDIFSKSVKDTS